jgi:hypothetical protein
VNETTSSHQRNDRRPYSPPRVSVLGDFRKITGGNNAPGTRDGGSSSPKTRTQMGGGA